MIWQFQDTNIYVLASVHVMAPDRNTPVDSINDILAVASKVIFEASLDCNDLPITRYINDQLSRNVSKTLFRDARNIWLKYGLSNSELNPSKIWSAALSISMQIFSTIGFDSKNGVDKIIWESSRNGAKDVDWLEDESVGLMCFENSPKEEQAKFLTETVRNKRKVVDSLIEIVEGWNSTSEEALLKILNTSLNEYPVIFNSLIIDRNIQWIPRFLESLKANTPTLFVVGALHCVGESSILKILERDHGYPSSLINAKS